MRQIVTDQQYAPFLLEWMTQRIGEPGQFSPDDCRTIAVIDVVDDTFDVLAVVALNRWTPFTCEGNIASNGKRNWFSQDFAFTVYDFVFRHAGKTRMNFTVRADNYLAQGLHERLGHKLECTLADGYGEGKDILLYGYTKKMWQEGRWATPKKGHIQEIS